MAPSDTSEGNALNGKNVVGKNVIGSIEPYNLGEDYVEYIERMDLLIDLNSIEAQAKIKFCIAFCGPELYKVLKSCIAPKKDFRSEL